MLYRLLFDTVESPLSDVLLHHPYWAVSNQSPNDGFSIAVITSIIQPDPFKQPLSNSSRLAVKGTFACSLNPCHSFTLKINVLVRKKRGKIWFPFGWQHDINSSIWLHHGKHINHFKCVVVFQSVMFCLICWLVTTWLLILHLQVVVKMTRFVQFQSLDPTFLFTQTRQDKTTLLHFDTFYSDDRPGTADSRLKLIEAGQEQ